MLDRLSRHIEEFFDLPAQFVYFPVDADEFSMELADALQTPQIRKPLKDFINKVCELPKMQAVAFMVDAWKGGGTKFLSIANVQYYFLHNNMLQINGQNELPHKWMVPVSRAAEESVDRMVRFYGNYVNTGGDLEETLIRFVRRTFQKDAGPFGTDRVEEEPPSLFLVGLIDRNE